MPEQLEGIELIKAVAERVMGYRQNKYALAEDNIYPSFAVGHSNIVICRDEDSSPTDWNPLKNMSDAWEIVDAIEIKYGYRLGLLHFDDTWEATFWIIGKDKPIVEVEYPVLGEAICRAALAAVDATG